jgi:hypothetical protein
MVYKAANSIALGYGLDDRGSGVRFPAWVPGALSLGVKRPRGREADHSPPSSAEVKNTWSYTSTLQYVFIAWCLVKHIDKAAKMFVVNAPTEMFLENRSLHIFIRRLVKCYDILISTPVFPIDFAFVILAMRVAVGSTLAHKEIT